MKISIVLILFVIVLPYSTAQNRDRNGDSDIILNLKDDFGYKKLIWNLVNRYHAYAGVTYGPPRKYIMKGEKVDTNCNVHYPIRVTYKTMKTFKEMFTKNTNIPNIATFDMYSENYVDYSLQVKEYLPCNGVIVESNDKNKYKKIFDPFFFSKSNLTKDNFGYRCEYNTSIRVKNGYDNKYKEVLFVHGRIIDLKLYILIDPEENNAKIYRIDKAIKKNNINSINDKL